MKAPYVFVAALLFTAEVRAHQCYSCASVRNTGGRIGPLVLPGFQSCDDPLIIDCTGQGGGCLATSFEMLYDVAGYGRDRVHLVQSGCGIALDQCISGTELEEAMDGQSQMFNEILEEGITYISTEKGKVCYCTDDLCNVPMNAATGWKMSFSTLFCSFLVFLVASKV